jgi:DNA-binding transcriptional MocR family regulator
LSKATICICTSIDNQRDEHSFEHEPTDLALDLVTFNEPNAGMFVWLKIPGISDTRKLIYEKALGQEVLLLPGSAFFADQSRSYPFVRVSYSLCTPEQIETV